MRNNASDVTQGLTTPAQAVVVAAVYRWAVTFLYKVAVHLIVAHACRRSRRALARLDDRLLDDIGLTRDQAQREAMKGCWM